MNLPNGKAPVSNPGKHVPADGSSIIVWIGSGTGNDSRWSQPVAMICSVACLNRRAAGKQDASGWFWKLEHSLFDGKETCSTPAIIRCVAGIGFRR